MKHFIQITESMTQRRNNAKVFTIEINQSSHTHTHTHTLFQILCTYPQYFGRIDQTK